MVGYAFIIFGLNFLRGRLIFGGFWLHLGTGVVSVDTASSANGCRCILSLAKRFIASSSADLFDSSTGLSKNPELELEAGQSLIKGCQSP